MTGHTRWESGQLAWYVRHYAWLVLICVLALAGAPLLLGAATPTYQADAIVVARQLTQRQEVLPLLGEQLFNTDAVEQRLAADPSIGGDTQGLIPQRVSLVVPRDSIIMTVQARDESPDVAARLATLGAEALVDELNRGGSGVGQFALQAPAVAPTQPLQATSPQLLATYGATAGLLVGLGLAALLIALRRPVLTAQDVQEAVGVPLLGRVHVPVGHRGSYPGPIGVRGIATVTRWMAGLPAGPVILTSPASIAGARQRIYVMVAVALSTVRTVRFRAAEELVRAVRRHRPELGAAPVDEADGTDRDDELVLVDGGSPVEILTATNLSVVVVATRGITRRRLRMVANDHQDAGLVGVVLVTVRRPTRFKPARVGEASARPADDATKAADESVAESERT